MGSIVADTHAVIWYLAASPKLSPIALASLEATAQAGDVIYIASISLVEVIYLAEKGRLPEIALQRLSNALTDPAMSFAVVPLDLAIAQRVQQIPRDLLPDMPDRIIAATALHLNLPLVTRDQRIQAIGIKTIW
ncbi:MAG: type II toxin-antitoxin system VapC family toxin [Candidatus Caldarchaeum sp.]